MVQKIHDAKNDKKFYYIRQERVLARALFFFLAIKERTDILANQDYPNWYLWQYPYKYERLKAEDLNNDESVVKLCEIILIGVNEEADDILQKLKRFPTNTEFIGMARNMYNCLRSDELIAISYGGSLSLADSFRANCPKGVFD